MTTAGTGNYEANDIRTAAIRPTSNMRFYGGYPKTLDGVDVSERNPGQYITLLSSNIVGKYDNSSAHGFGIINAQNVIIDGVRMAYGNVVGMETTSIVKKGTGIILSNTTISAEDRIDMVGNELRNSVIANTQAYDGSAIYVNSVMPKEDNSIARTVLTVKNTVIRNCTTKYDESMGNEPLIAQNPAAGTLVDPGFVVEGTEPELLGWARPFRFNQYSADHSYFNWCLGRLDKEVAMDTNLHGGPRAFVMPDSYYAKHLPMDIYPLYLVKACLAGDIDNMEKFGIYEVLPEDLALVEFMDPSKNYVQDIIQNGIDLMLKEMA